MVCRTSGALNHRGLGAYVIQDTVRNDGLSLVVTRSRLEVKTGVTGVDIGD